MAKAKRICRVCGLQAHSLDDLALFRTNKQLAFEKDNLCKQCHSEQRREDHLLRTYGLSLDDYERMLEAQKGACAICKETEAGHGSKYLCVDHCHTSGKVRKLLCHNCNVGLGKFKDDIELLEEAITYLRGYYE